MNKSILDNKKAACLQKENGNFGFWYHLGNDYLSIDEAAEAIACYETALKFDPLIFDTYSHIGEAYLRLDNLSEAINYFKKSVDCQPQFGMGWYNLGHAYSLTSEMEQCLYCYKKAIHCFILSSDDSFYRMGRTFLFENDLKNAEYSFNLGMNTASAKAKKTYKRAILLSMGHIHFLRGDIELAKASYYKSTGFFGNLTNIEADLPDLIKIGLDAEKWHNLIVEIKSPKKIYFKIYLNRMNNYVGNQVLKTRSIKERLIKYSF